MSLPPALESPRLLLRPFCREDAPAMFQNWASDEAVCRYLTWRPHSSQALTQQMIASWCKGYQRGDFLHWCLVEKSSRQPIGMLGVTKACRQEGWAEMGYCLGRAWWGKGYAREALEQAVAYLAGLGFRQLQASCQAGNTASAALLVRCGFVAAGSSEDGTNYWGKRCKLLHFTREL